MTGLETIAGPAITKLIVAKLFGDSVKFTKSFQDKIKKLNAEDKVIQNYLKTAEKIKRVRTISFTEKDVQLEDIYVPLNINSPTNTNYLIDSSVNIPHVRTMNIIGRAGQGKSTILRRLFLNCLNKGKTIPFFFELKYFKNDSLEKNLINEFKKWGLVFDEETVLEFITSKDISLFLDAFDEIPSENEADVFEQIELLETTYNCSVIMTSRPNTDICKRSNIDNFQVSDLKPEQVFAILDVAAKDKNQANNLKAALKSKEHVLEFIKSPILAVLLQIVYAHSNSVPNSLIDFYNKVFLTLYHRHDELKTNVIRHFKTELTCDQSEKIFQAFCYFGLKNNELSFTKETALKLINDALEIRGGDGIKSEDYFHDIYYVTNIIQEDGYDNYTFFHRSLQEFYTYKFIKNFFDSEQKKSFFNACLNNPLLQHKFSLVLNFFSDDQEETANIEHYLLPLTGFMTGLDKSIGIEQAAMRCISSATYTLSGSFNSRRMDMDSAISMVGVKSKYECLDILIRDNVGINNAILNPGFRNSENEKNTYRSILEKLDLEGMPLNKNIQCSGLDFYEKIMDETQRQAYLKLYIESETIALFSNKFRLYKARLEKKKETDTKKLFSGLV